MIYVKRWLEFYDKVFALEENQVQFMDNLCRKFPAPAKFLSIDAGTASTSRELNKLGHNVTVTDTFVEFKKFIDELCTETNQASDNPNPIQSYNLNPMDIVRYLGKETYNVIYCADYRLVFLKDKISIQKLMIDCKKMLSENGYLVVDLINFARLDFGQPRIDLPTKKAPDAQLYSYILKDSDSIKYFLNQQVVTNDGKIIDEVKQEEITPISMESFKKFTSELGFSSIDFYSDYKGSPLTPDSEKIICVIKK